MERCAVRRSGLQAYLIGAGVAGTLLVFPYTGRAVLSVVVPDVAVARVPFFLLPVLWGAWNWLYVRRHPPVGIAAWGALLGLWIALAANALLWWEGQWFAAALLLPAFLCILYWLIWLFVVGPLDDALGAG
jgi:hypothetical protein